MRYNFKILPVFILGLIIIPGIIGWAFKMPSRGVVTASALNVREGPGMSYSVLGTLPNGTTVSIVDVSGSWYKVNAGSYKGKFVYSGYIDVTETTEIDDNNAAKYLYPALSATDLSKPSTANSTPKFLPRSDF